jgi:hypothetical protein
MHARPFQRKLKSNNSGMTMSSLMKIGLGVSALSERKHLSTDRAPFLPILKGEEDSLGKFQGNPGT